MAIDRDRLLELAIPDVEQNYTEKDLILYALGVGVGLDPGDEAQLDFVYERNLKVLPTVATVLAHPGFWMRDLNVGIDWVKAVHGEESLVLHRPLAPRGAVIGKSRVIDAIDKGVGRGALIVWERNLFDKASGAKLATVTATAFCRGDGGFGGPPRPQSQPHTLPSRNPDLVCDLPTHSSQALIYRLSGDRNPLHAEPAIGIAAGYRQPILHGLATYGIAGHAVLKSVAAYRPERIASMAARFTAPVFPGETFRTEIWLDDDVVSFQTRAIERDAIAIGNGRIGLRA